MKKKIKIFLISVIILFLLPVTLYYILSWSAFLFPDTARNVEIGYSKLSSDKLINRLSAFNFLWRETAIRVLAERKEEKAVPYFIKLLNFPDKYARASAIRALGKIGDKRAIKPLMRIVRKGRANPDYLEALVALSELHYIPIYKEILEMVKDNFHTSYAVDMLEQFPENPETREMLQKIAEEDPKEYIRRKAIKAIKHIESFQQTKIQETETKQKEGTDLF